MTLLLLPLLLLTLLVLLLLLLLPLLWRWLLRPRWRKAALALCPIAALRSIATLRLEVSLLRVALWAAIKALLRGHASVALLHHLRLPRLLREAWA